MERKEEQSKLRLEKKRKKERSYKIFWKNKKKFQKN